MVKITGFGSTYCVFWEEVFKMHNLRNCTSFLVKYLRSDDKKRNFPKKHPPRLSVKRKGLEKNF